MFDEDVWVAFARSFKSNLNNRIAVLDNLEACDMVQSQFVLIKQTN